MGKLWWKTIRQSKTTPKQKGMTKYYCDKCQEETNDLFVIPIYVHIKSENPLMGHCKMIKGKTYPTSGRTENTDLCIKCYNEIMFPLWETLNK